MTISIQQIKEIIPHRYPFLLIDRVDELKAGVHATAVKNVTANEEFFNGHFPDHPVMPGVLIVEALAQTGAVALLSMPEYKGKLALFAGIDNLRFKRQVVPGDTLTLHVELKTIRRNIGKGTAVATVNGEVACQGEIMFAIQ